MTPSRTVRIGSLALLLAVLAPAGAQAQLGPDQSVLGWAPAMLGVRFGNQQRTGNWMLGAQIRIPVIRSGKVELMPNGDMTFLHGSKEYGYSADLSWVSGGRSGGLYAGAGPAWRRGVFSDSGVRETRTGWDLVVGLKTMPGRGIPFGLQLEERWVFMRMPINPRVLSLGVNLPLWGWGHFGR